MGHTCVFEVVVDGGRVVTVPVVGGVVEVVPVDESAEFQILKNQNEGSVIGADSGPVVINDSYFIDHLCL